jgi:methylthioribose-1-phosphate isomerase
MDPSVIRAVEWTGAGIRLLDQTRLPDEVTHLDVTDVDGVVDAVRRLVVRGAPALGTVGAFGVAIAARQAAREQWADAEFERAVARIRDARPTAVALALGVDAARRRLSYGTAGGVDAVIEFAIGVLERDEHANHAIARHGADWILSRVERRPLRVLTHCNTGALAAAGVGTALGIVGELHRRGDLDIVYVDETRPLLQGSRLTAWELAVAGIPHLVQVDGAAAGTVLRAEVDVAVVGADRIAANGDVANKVGTVGVALACAYAGVPFIVAAPHETIDPAAPTGAAIPIEYRPADEVLGYQGLRAAPVTSGAHNPAFDVTPASLVSALVTERGITVPAPTAASSTGRR